ncbi:hypothetical protein F5146DRAFT_671306 [Armillaria mellea]|nr:hypothetical protein F5146DRAFT_671306 [Armillaria mellea]
MELPGSDALRKERARRLNAIAVFRRRKPDVTAEKLRTRYPIIPEVPRKTSVRQIVARQRCEGESNNDFQKRLRLAEKKRVQRAEKRVAQQSESDSGAPALGPSKRRKRADEVPLKVPDNPALLPRVPSFIDAGEASPSSAENVIQTEIGVPLSVSSDVSSVSRHRIRIPGDSSAPPDHVVLPCISEGSKTSLQPSGNYSSSDQASRDEKTIDGLHKELQILSKQMTDSRPRFPSCKLRTKSCHLHLRLVRLSSSLQRQRSAA